MPGAAAGAGGIGFELFMASSFYYDMQEVGAITLIILALIYYKAKLTCLCEQLKPIFKNCFFYKFLFFFVNSLMYRYNIHYDVIIYNLFFQGL